MIDETLIALYFDRDETCISKTKEIYGKRLNRIANSILRNIEDADECENDTYLIAWNNIPPKNPQSYLFSFLAKITRNNAINLYNKLHTKKRYAHIIALTTEMEECIPNPTAESIESQLAITDVLNTFLKSLPKIQRDTFICRYWYGKSIEELSKQFGFSQSKVKSMLFRTRNKLKLHFESEGLFL